MEVEDTEADELDEDDAGPKVEALQLSWIVAGQRREEVGALVVVVAREAAADDGLVVAADQPPEKQPLSDRERAFWVRWAAEAPPSAGRRDRDRNGGSWSPLDPNKNAVDGMLAEPEPNRDWAEVCRELGGDDAY